MRSDFGTINNLKATLYTLENKNVSFSVTNYGATLVSLIDKKSSRDVVLGLANASLYQNQNYYLGATIGRVANRIKDSKFTLNGEEYTLTTNNQGNHLHGGIVGFDKKFFNVEEKDNEIVFTYLSTDGEEGYPGNLFLEVTYKLLDDGISIITKADCDKDTLAAFTNHAYFNVDAKGEVLDNKLTIYADKYSPNDECSLALEELKDVEGTVFDFRQAKRINENMDEMDSQLITCGGYDHYFEVDGEGLRKMATVEGEEVILEMYSDYPGLHFFLANFKEPLILKDKKAITGRAALCLEAEYHPNAINYDSVVKKPILRKEDTQVHEIQYHLTTKVSRIKKDNDEDFPLEEVKALSKQAKESKWRSYYHEEVPCGINHGITRFNFKDGYSIDYVWQPLIDEEYTYWQNITSKDLTIYETQGRRLKPDLLWDDDGCDRGTSFIDGGEEFLIYSSKHIDHHGRTNYYVLIAKLDEDTIIKGRRPLFTFDKEISNPKILKENNKYYLFVTSDEGELIYRSDSLVKGWEEIGKLKLDLGENVFDELKDVTLNKLEDNWILTFLDNDNYYYALGKLNLLNLSFRSEEVNKLDEGFDFFRPFISKDKNIMVGLLDKEEMTKEDGYAGALSIARSLEVKNNKLIQKPAIDIIKVIEDTIFLVEDGQIKKDNMQGKMPKHAIIDLENLNDESFEFNVFAIEKENGLQIKYEKYTKRLIVDRSNLSKEVDDKIVVALENGCDKLKAFFDGRLVEIFVNEGEMVFSLIIFPDDANHLIRMSAKDVNLSIYSAKNINK